MIEIWNWLKSLFGSSVTKQDVKEGASGNATASYGIMSKTNNNVVNNTVINNHSPKDVFWKDKPKTLDDLGITHIDGGTF